jgi:hypothetical protein
LSIGFLPIAIWLLSSAGTSDPIKGQPIRIGGLPTTVIELPVYLNGTHFRQGSKGGFEL